jgi:hypothetical protein
MLSDANPPSRNIRGQETIEKHSCSGPSSCKQFSDTALASAPMLGEADLLNIGMLFNALLLAPLKEK